MVNANLEQYRIAGVREIPPIEVLIVEDYRGRSSTDAGGIGEPATVPTASSIANAFYNATGVRLRTLPMTPDRVLAALASAKKEGRP
jgi:xanthine dehydrogenase YagR molybdenum-binding subunit